MAYRVEAIDIPEDEPFRFDVLDRKSIVEFLTGLLTRITGPFVMAIDSPWGSGKTTLIKMLSADLKRNGFQCLYFNAWTVDYVTDPLVALVSSLDSVDLGNESATGTYRKHLKNVKKITNVVAKRGLIAVAKATTLGALDLEKEMEAVASELTGNVVGDVVDNFNRERELLKTFRDQLATATEQLTAADINPAN